MLDLRELTQQALVVPSPLEHAVLMEALPELDRTLMDDVQKITGGQTCL